MTMNGPSFCYRLNASPFNFSFASAVPLWLRARAASAPRLKTSSALLGPSHGISRQRFRDASQSTPTPHHWRALKPPRVRSARGQSRPSQCRLIQPLTVPPNHARRVSASALLFLRHWLSPNANSSIRMEMSPSSSISRKLSSYPRTASSKTE